MVICSKCSPANLLPAPPHLGVILVSIKHRENSCTVLRRNFPEGYSSVERGYGGLPAFNRIFSRRSCLPALGSAHFLSSAITHFSLLSKSSMALCAPRCHSLLASFPFTMAAVSQIMADIMTKNMLARVLANTVTIPVIGSGWSESAVCY